MNAAYVHPQFPGLSFLTAPANGSAADIPLTDFSRLLAQARKDFDYVFLDSPSGLGDGMAIMAKNADRCVVTTLPDPASIRNAERTGQELEKMGCSNVRLVVNRVYSDLMKALDMNIDDVMDAVGLPLLGVVPSDPNVNFAATKGKPLLKYSRMGAAAACKRIAKRLLGLSAPVVSR